MTTVTATPRVLGRILGRLALGEVDDHTTSALVSGPPGYLPPEPLRSLGGVVVRDAVRRAEAAEERGREAGGLTDALRRLVWFTVPRALEPRMWRRTVSSSGPRKLEPPADVTSSGR
jgi:hypothetical protein